MSGPEESNAALPIQLVRCPAGHYHVPGPCPICDGTAPVTAPTQAVAFPRRRSPLSWLFVFNVVTASLAVVAVAVAWVAIFHEPNRPAPAEPAKVEQAAQVRPTSAMEPAPQPAPAAATPPTPAPTPAPTPPAAAPSQPAGTANAAAPETGGETVIAAPAPLSPAPLPVPRPASADAPPVDAAAASQQQAPNPALMAALQPQPPRSSLPLPQRLGVPPGVIQQVRWLDGRTIEILVRALDRQPDETDVIEERPSGDVVRARLRSGPRPCRYMEIYPAQRSSAFMLMRFCPDAMGRWMGQEIGGY